MSNTQFEDEFKVLGTPKTIKHLNDLMANYPANTRLEWRNQKPQELGVLTINGQIVSAWQQKEEEPPESKEYLLMMEIFEEFDRAESKHPDWPVDLLHQIAIVNEESGEATRAALHVVYENGKISDLKKELIQTAAMCLRMLTNLD